AGALYLARGERGAGGEPGNRGQTRRNLFGCWLRFDVDNGTPYSIPPSNPSAGNALCNNLDGTNGADTSCPEIFAWGLRNPWRWSFDANTGEIWLADVVQDRRGEIKRITVGGNDGGWRGVGNQCVE